MNDYILLMHDDVPADRRPAGDGWPAYIARLRAAGAFQGGSSLGGGVCVRQDSASPPITGHLAGFIRIRAADLDAACALVAGNPVFEAGGTVEVRELPRDE